MNCRLSPVKEKVDVGWAQTTVIFFAICWPKFTKVREWP